MTFSEGKKQVEIMKAKEKAQKFQEEFMQNLTVGKIEQLTDTKPPRTMPHTFARQGETIKRLQSELDAANDSLIDLSEWSNEVAAERDELREWAQRAYAYMQECATQAVIMTPLLPLMQDAPESVKGGDK